LFDFCGDCEQIAADIAQTAQAAINPVRIPFLFFIIQASLPNIMPSTSGAGIG
jgi:hypothetical protein